MSTLELNGKDFATQVSSAEPVLASTVTGGAGLSGSTSLGTVTVGNLSHANIIYPAGHVIQMKQDVINTQFSLSVSAAGIEIDGTNFKVGLTPKKTGNNIIINFQVTFGRATTYGAGFFCKRTGPSTVSPLDTVGTGGSTYDSVDMNAGAWHYPALLSVNEHTSSIWNATTWASDTAQDTTTEHVYTPLMRTNASSGTQTFYINQRSDSLWAGASVITVWEVVV